MQVMAFGKWSKADRNWKMVVAMRRPSSATRETTTATADRPSSSGRRPDPGRDGR